MNTAKLIALTLVPTVVSALVGIALHKLIGQGDGKVFVAVVTLVTFVAVFTPMTGKIKGSSQS